MYKKNNLQIYIKEVSDLEVVMKHLFAVEQMGAGLAQITKVYLKRQMETEKLNYQKLNNNWSCALLIDVVISI